MFAVALAVAASGLVVAGLATAGHSSRRDKQPPPGPSLPAAAPTGYVQIDSGELPLPDSSALSGQATCPAGTVVWGGGVVIASTDIHANVNSSYPLASKKGWLAWVDNTSGADTTFHVYAVCAKQPAGYKIVAKKVLIVPKGTTTGHATCPAGAVALSGGGYLPVRSTEINLSDSHPTLAERYGSVAGWVTDVVSTIGGNDKLTAYVVCAKPAPAGYEVRQESVKLDAGTQQGTTADCSSGKVVTGAGSFTSGKLARVNTLEAIGPGAGAWANSDDEYDQKLVVYGICVS
jgi:hypothetical protein